MPNSDQPASQLPDRLPEEMRSARPHASHSGKWTLRQSGCVLAI